MFSSCFEKNSCLISLFSCLFSKGLGVGLVGEDLRRIGEEETDGNLSYENFFSIKKEKKPFLTWGGKELVSLRQYLLRSADRSWGLRQHLKLAAKLGNV